MKSRWTLVCADAGPSVSSHYWWTGIKACARYARVAVTIMATLVCRWMSSSSARRNVRSFTGNSAISQFHSRIILTRSAPARDWIVKAGWVALHRAALITANWIRRVFHLSVKLTIVIRSRSAKLTAAVQIYVIYPHAVVFDLNNASSGISPIVRLWNYLSVMRPFERSSIGFILQSDKIVIGRSEMSAIKAGKLLSDTFPFFSKIIPFTTLHAHDLA